MSIIVDESTYCTDMAQLCIYVTFHNGVRFREELLGIILMESLPFSDQWHSRLQGLTASFTASFIKNDSKVPRSLTNMCFTLIFLVLRLSIRTALPFGTTFSTFALNYHIPEHRDTSVTYCITPQLQIVLLLYECEF